MTKCCVCENEATYFFIGADLCESCTAKANDTSSDTYEAWAQAQKKAAAPLERGEFVVVTPAAGTKHDSGKAPWHLLPFDALAEIVDVLRMGAAKYGDRNWERGIVHSRTIGATFRHLTAWWQGENRDPESGKSHLAHAACEVLFALAFECRGREDLDDRPTAQPARTDVDRDALEADLQRARAEIARLTNDLAQASADLAMARGGSP